MLFSPDDPGGAPPATPPATPAGDPPQDPPATSPATPQGAQPPVDPEAVNNAVAAALRKRDIETARKLLEAELKPEPVDLTKFVPVEKFDEAVKQIGELKSTYEQNQHRLAVENIITRHSLTTSDVELIQTDDLELFEKRAQALAGRSNAATRAAVVRSEIPDDMKGNDLYRRLM
jgi:hypothetical protein